MLHKHVIHRNYRDDLSYIHRKLRIGVVQMGPKAEDVSGPLNPLSFLWGFFVGTVASLYYVAIPIFMWLKDQVYPKTVKFVEE